MSLLPTLLLPSPHPSPPLPRYSPLFFYERFGLIRDGAPEISVVIIIIIINQTAPPREGEQTITSYMAGMPLPATSVRC